MAVLPPVSIVVINLDRDVDRLNYMRSQLERQGLGFERFAAVSGAALPPELREYFPLEEDGTGFLSKGEIGCYASHLGVYQRIANGQIAAPALVLEDDVELSSDFAAFLACLINALPKDWDLVRLSSPAKLAYIAVAQLDPVHALARYSISPGSNGALLVSQAGALKFLKPQERRLPIDQDNRLVWEFGLNLYGVVPAPIRGNALQTSSIDDLAAGSLRDDRARQRSLRRQRKLSRHHAWNIAKFGVAAWGLSEAVNIVAPLIGRRQRPAFLSRMSQLLRTIAKPKG